MNNIKRTNKFLAVLGFLTALQAVSFSLYAMIIVGDEFTGSTFLPRKVGSYEFIEQRESLLTLEKFHEYYKLTLNNDAEGQYYMGIFFSNGYVVQKDYKEAAAWFTKAAHQNHIEAQYYLGLLYNDGLYGFRGGRDFKAAFHWFSKAADQNYAPAQYNICLLYDKEQGIEKDKEKAAEWCLRAAEQNYAPAQCQLANLYRWGRGVKQDYKIAVEWYSLAAKQGTLKWPDEQDWIKATMTLHKSGREEDQKVSRPILRSFVENKNLYILDIAETLFVYGDTEDKKIGRQKLYDMHKRPEDYEKSWSRDNSTVIKIKTANLLIKYGDKIDQELAAEELGRVYFAAASSKTSKDSAHILYMMSLHENPFQWEAQWVSPHLHTTKGSYEYYDAISKIAQQENHPYRYDAAKILYQADAYFHNKEKNIGKYILNEIAQKEGHPKQKEAKDDISSCIIF